MVKQEKCLFFGHVGLVRAVHAEAGTGCVVSAGKIFKGGNGTILRELEIHPQNPTHRAVLKQRVAVSDLQWQRAYV